MRLGETVQLSLLPRSMEFIPMRQMLNSMVSRYRDARSRMARLFDIS